MNLQTYLKGAGKTQAAFASEVGTTHATISRLVAGKFQPSLRLAILIEQQTAGNVSASSWLRPQGATA